MVSTCRPTTRWRSTPPSRAHRRASTELDAEDLEFLEPPTSIWKAISATVDAEREPPASRTAHGLRHSDALTVAYRIDADDHVVSMGDGWSNFARDNGAPELAELTGTCKRCGRSSAATPAAVFGR